MIKLWGLKPSKDPLPIGFVGRKRGVDFRDTTLESFKRIIPTEHYRLHDSEHEIIIQETVKLFCGGLDNQERINKFNSAEFAFFAIDQAEETERTDVDVLQGALRLKVGGIQPPYKQLYTANPADCWLKEDFISNKRSNHYYVHAKYTDNPHLPANYKETLESAFSHNDPLLRAYRDGDWYSLEAANVLITDLMLTKLKDVRRHYKDIRRIVSCDPSLGGDECVIQVIENGRVIEQKILHERDTMKVAGHIQVLAHKHKAFSFCVDSIGLGQGIADRLKELLPNAYVHALNSAETASDEERFSNVRAEMWWNAMTQVQDQMVPWPVDEELRTQLMAPRFKVVSSNGKVQLEPKSETKKRLGRSPDRADAYVMGMYVLPRTTPIKTTDRWEDMPSRGEVSSATTSAMAA